MPSHGAALGGAEVSPRRPPKPSPTPVLRRGELGRQGPQPESWSVRSRLSRLIQKSPALRGRRRKSPGGPRALAPRRAACGQGFVRSLCLGTRGWPRTGRKDAQTWASGSEIRVGPHAGLCVLSIVTRGAPRSVRGAGVQRPVGSHRGPRLALSCSIACKPHCSGAKGQVGAVDQLRNCYFPLGGFVFGFSITEL